ncbi:TIGR03557 family F420-dependent LLM class oxidoreductase [Pseudonocardia xinjiangensis]|uniref:TIGR03557 family F420-dependent LLM class oxidoreductase n=1 Tax=Pseudonocardia xinjiangensis TaxID=75289 RepID=A0ABX1RLX9_9PSEU|nr:TIGR03557 family F420-dependent LLM class oxidoreductase [Pseudonocardia xinjiangensis]NMH80380.1 TIGR03557 family F420-dependent LLM class oxidoreductase [Pseudonocardia xinjiangensis]
MVAFGYSLLCEQRGPRELVADAVAAEEAGFDFEVISDHYFPWLDSQGHAPNAWPVLGAIAAATERVSLMTYVTCPIMRYHPTVVAQKAATVALLAGEGRFTLGLGAGENLNEHVIGKGWPPANVRHEMLGEAVEIIGELFAGGYVNRSGTHYRVDSAKLWDVPDGGVPIAVAVSGKQSIETFAPVADAMVAVEPLPELVQGFDAATGVSLPKIGQQPISWGVDRDEAVARAHDQFRWFGGGWKVNAELPGTAAFAAATQFVRPHDVADAFPCGPDVAAHVEAVRPFVDAGFTHVALVQVGGETQTDFIAFAEHELLPALREEYGKPENARIRVR